MKFKTLALFIGGTAVIGLLLGYSNVPDGWYASLTKPSFNPPNAVFAPVWTLLYILIGIAGARTWTKEPRGLSMWAWAVQMALNWAWSPTFFSLHRIGVALALILLMLISILTFMTLRWRKDRTAALCFVPYALWVAFASLLNLSIYRLN